MTSEQFERWRDFALRMASTCWSNRNRPSRDWIVEQVESIFGQLDERDIPFITDWDNSEPYPPGHLYARVDPWSKHHAHPAYMCDWMSEWETETIYYYWREYATVRERAQIDAAQTRADDDTADELIEAIVDRWSSPVRCCIRAGLDCDSAPSAGVLGFTLPDSAGVVL